MHVGFVARADLAGDQRQVGTGDSYQVAAGFQFRTLLGDVVELGGGFGAAFFCLLSSRVVRWRRRPGSGFRRL